MAKARLDTSRPYAQVYGPGTETEGAVHTQDGFFYDQHDVIMPAHHMYSEEQADEAAKLFAAMKPEPRPAPQEKAKEITEKVAGKVAASQRKPEPPPPPIPPRKKSTGNKAADVDLKAWALSERSYPFMAVRAAISSQYSFQAHNAESARAFLVDQGLIRASDLE